MHDVVVKKVHVRYISSPDEFLHFLVDLAVKLLKDEARYGSLSLGAICVFYADFSGDAGLAGMIFFVLHGMPVRTSDEKGVCPSVKRVDCDKTT